MNEFENDPTIDDQIVDVTDLDPIQNSSRISRMFDTLAKRPLLRRRFWRFSITGCSILLVALVLFGTFPSARGLTSNLLARLKPAKKSTLVIPIPTPAASYLFDPNDEVVWSLGDSSPFIPSATLGPAPRDCPMLSQTYPFQYRGAPRAAGSSPVLIIGFGGPDAVITNFKHAQYPEIGWYKRIVLLTETNYTGTITLRGGEMHDGSPIWFGMRPNNQGPVTNLTMVPLNTTFSNHTGGDEGWGLSTTTMYIPRAGCYFLMATWSVGSWIVYFSAGR
jgi:hypothetical protein